jgi:hypothetical protein
MTTRRIECDQCGAMHDAEGFIDTINTDSGLGYIHEWWPHEGQESCPGCRGEGECEEIVGKSHDGRPKTCGHTAATRLFAEENGEVTNCGVLCDAHAAALSLNNIETP